MQRPMPDQLKTEWTRIRQLHSDAADPAWSWFIERYDPLVRALLAKRLPPADANAATAEFWAYLWQSRSLLRADPVRSLRGYLFGILNRYAAVWLRDHCRMHPLLEHLPDASATTEDDLAAWACDCLGHALATLRRTFPRDALALECFYGVGAASDALSVPEIARRMQASVASVQQHLSRGRARLRQVLLADLRRTIDSSDGYDCEVQLLFERLNQRIAGLGHG